jgi:hypothetical protein
MGLGRLAISGREADNAASCDDLAEEIAACTEMTRADDVESDASGGAVTLG